ncbi:MAG TPA: DUF3108 domain-containing protein [Candidatus Limnocylindria bacterium]|nr:DUF3108 domain-containing protein [Candidatus Limnocylindria bacterium]
MNGSFSPGNREWCWFLLLTAALVLLATGCYRATQKPAQESSPPVAATGDSKPAAMPAEGTAASLPPQEPQALPGNASSPIPEVSPPETAPEGPPGESPPESSLPFPAGNLSEKESSTPGPPPETAGNGKGAAPSGVGATVAALPPRTGPGAPVPGADTGRGTVDIVKLPEERAFSQEGPPWTRGKEELVYKVEFLGITMGYARLSFLGKVLLSGKEAYHLRVRAWTSDLLSVIYPMDDTIDYYLDVETIAPLRQEFTRSKKRDDVAVYDQEKGTIVYRYRKDGKVRKKVDVVPNVYDPVSVAYYFRTRGPKGGAEGRSMYAGRKLWEVSAKSLGYEKIRTDKGEFDTIIVQPVLRQGGKLETKKEMRMWMTRDERHVPVRLYAKFKKIRSWTLVGELLPDQQGG